MPKKEIVPVEPNTDLSKEAFLEEINKMRPDLNLPEIWSDDTKAKAAEFIRPEQVKKQMFGVIPMICKSTCPVKEVCPLVKAGIQPLTKPCPLETSLIAELMQSYMVELGINPQSMIEVGMIRDLVNQEIQQHRVTWILSLEHFIQENVVGVSPNGDIIKQKQLHLAVELEDKIQKRKKEIRNQLLATREARAKAGQGNIDTAQAISNLLGEVRKIERSAADQLFEKAGIKSSDSYIEAEIVDDDGTES